MLSAVFSGLLEPTLSTGSEVAVPAGRRGSAVVGGMTGRSGQVWPPGLPMPLTALVGRECELTEVARLVMANRLVTLVGAGGVGKTRLALEAAAALAARFANGVAMVDLSGML